MYIIRSRNGISVGGDFFCNLYGRMYCVQVIYELKKLIYSMWPYEEMSYMNLFHNVGWRGYV